MVRHTVVGSASPEILAPRPAATALVTQARMRFVGSFIIPIQLRACKREYDQKLIARMVILPIKKGTKTLLTEKD